MAQGNPLPGERYLHFKNKLYQIITIAYHSETMERYVVYQALYGDFHTFIRPYDMFISEVDHKKYPEVKQKYRFQYMENKTETQMPDAEEAEVKEKEPAANAVPEGVNPWLIRFLDAEGFEERYKVVCDMQSEMTDRLIDDIAVVMDLAIPEGKLSDRYTQLKYCMRTRQRYEGSRDR